MNRMHMYRRAIVTAVLAAAFAVPAGAQQSFPDKPVTMVVPFAAGGAVDMTTRIICEEADKALGQKLPKPRW